MTAAVLTPWKGTAESVSKRKVHVDEHRHHARQGAARFAVEQIHEHAVMRDLPVPRVWRTLASRRRNGKILLYRIPTKMEAKCLWL